MEIKTKVWIEKERKLIFGSEKASILKTIVETGSINKTAKKMNMSYRHAWSYLQSIEKRIGIQMLIKVKGGKDGGGAILTDYAKDLIKKFEMLECETRLFADRRFKEIFKKDEAFSNHKNKSRH